MDCNETKKKRPSLSYVPSTCFGFIFHSVQWFLNLCQGTQKELAKNSTHTCFHMLYKIASVFWHVINSFLIIPSDKGVHDSRFVRFHSTKIYFASIMLWDTFN